MQNDITAIFKKMSSKGVSFEPGMSDAEFAAAEEATGIKLPDDLKEMLRIALPLDSALYNWRDLSPQNVKAIKEMAEWPYTRILGSIIKENYWCSDWGPRPSDIDEAVSLYKAKYKEAPKLVPFYLHRYAVQDQYGKTRVISSTGVDTILLAESLLDCLQIEYDYDNHTETESFKDYNFDEFPFWGQLDF